MQKTSNYKIIAFALWGDNPVYTIGAIRNVELAKNIYPGWQCHFYVNRVPDDILKRLSEFKNVSVHIMIPSKWAKYGRRAGDAQPENSMFWKFMPYINLDFEHKSNSFMLSRDTDSRLSWRERYAVDEWMSSGKLFHIMRDHPNHNAPILGGMWGMRGGFAGLNRLILNYKQTHKKLVDQHFLADIIYPKIKNNCLVHDEIFAKKPFPQPRQNAEFVGQCFDAKDRPNRQYAKILNDYFGWTYI